MCTTFSRRRNHILTPSYDLVFVTNPEDYPPTNVFIQHLTTPGFKSPRSSIEESFIRSIHHQTLSLSLSYLPHASHSAQQGSERHGRADAAWRWDQDVMDSRGSED
ncbi:hypothetical protein AB1N83_001220 [Pleurotus pulmonarius]